MLEPLIMIRSIYRCRGAYLMYFWAFWALICYTSSSNHQLIIWKRSSSVQKSNREVKAVRTPLIILHAHRPLYPVLLIAVLLVQTVQRKCATRQLMIRDRYRSIPAAVRPSLLTVPTIVQIVDMTMMMLRLT